MEQKFSTQGDAIGGAAGPSPVTRAKVDARARALAASAGRTPPHVTQVDYQQAKRELTGETDLDRQNAMLDGLPTSLVPQRAG